MPDLKPGNTRFLPGALKNQAKSKKKSVYDDGDDVRRCQRFGAAVLQPHKQDGVMNVAMKRMPRITTEGHVKAFNI